MLNFDYRCSKGLVNLGLEAAQGLFNDRVIISIDPGIKNLVGVVASLGSLNEQGQYSGNFKKLLMVFFYALVYLLLEIHFLLWND